MSNLVQNMVAYTRIKLHIIHYTFCNLIQALRSKNNHAHRDKRSCSEYQTLFLAHARKTVWAHDLVAIHVNF